MRGTATVREVLGVGAAVPVKMWAVESRPNMTTTAKAIVLHASDQAGAPKVPGLQVRSLDVYTTGSFNTIQIMLA